MAGKEKKARWQEWYNYYETIITIIVLLTMNDKWLSELKRQEWKLNKICYLCHCDDSLIADSFELTRFSSSLKQYNFSQSSNVNFWYTHQGTHIK